METTHVFGMSMEEEASCSTDTTTAVSSSKLLCSRCKLEFPSCSELYNHRQQCIGKRPNSFFCRSCKRKFYCRLLLFQHRCTTLYRRRLSNKKLLQKNLAMARGWVEKQQQKSSSEENIDGDVLTCKICEKEFFSVDDYQLHRSKGLCRRLTCDICNMEFDGLDELCLHEIHCKDKQRTKDKLKEKHLELERLQKSRSYNCRACKKAYDAPLLLKNHLQKHPYCTRVHNMKIKLRCMWERGEDLSKTARKSIINMSGRSLKPSYQWESESSDGYEAPVLGAARKSFPRVEDKGGFCDVCYRFFGSSGALRTHKEKHYESINKCPQCLESFPNSESLTDHQNEKDHWGKATKSITTTCICPFCEKEFLLVQSRNAHLRSHVSEYPEEVKEFLQETTCDMCSQIFVSETAKVQHVRIKHSSGEGKTLNSDIIFQSHKYVGYNKNVVKNVTPSIALQLKKNPTECPICFKRYSTSFIRNRHFRTHTLDQAFECKFCPTKFPRSDRLALHMQQEHNNSLAYECKECNLRFMTRMKGLQHCSKAHSHLPAKNLIKERFVPSICKKTSTTNNETVIPDEEFYCDVCDLSFLKLCGLQKHRQSKLHREIQEKSRTTVQVTEEGDIERPPLSLTPPFIDYSKKLICSGCSMEFDSVNDFVPHRLSHFSSQKGKQNIDEQNTYTCEVCGKIMDSHQKIQLHLFWHLQDIQLQAGPRKSSNSEDQPIARKSFKKDVTEKHELVVAGIKKPLFTCDACGIGFTTLNHYTIHNQQYCKGIKSSQTSNLSTENKNVKTCVTAGFCKICGCIFSSSTLYEEHKAMFCNNNTFMPLSEDVESLYTEMIKSLIKLNTMVAGCVRCNLAFDTMKCLSKHSLKHIVLANGKTVDIPNEESNGITLNECDIIDTKSQVLLLKEDKKVEENNTDSKVNLTDNKISLESVIEDKPDKTEAELTDSIEELRSNFTQLLSILVSDQELMEQLGYKEKQIEEVLINVLVQMGLTPASDDSCSASDNFQQNIRILLDVCIKDQVMEFLANSETTTNSMVLAALKMFEEEEQQSESDIS